ncbi:cytochrome P450, putative [Talaromyces stipitatus ATCC 10500]|uniref:Cytochrome P450, putative n=1 Tax=Talaromyces stipitatus (strain ATCC 10500 / CBS 375.48 / QM 6759 / NRRL 1006) TaxID=441959 RepID=B8MJ64_TALSN|nr:cytochrome P450, putative [Talaromyces stipitatus ATCC 10500]EED14653.1 cytochrome P450, putative [Talaromyces stipitatus ATCC 10500]
MYGNVVTRVATLSLKNGTSSMEHLCVQWFYYSISCTEVTYSGPEEITIFHPAAHEAMDGPGNNNVRLDWYDLLYPHISSIFTRDRDLHNARRKMWEHALSRTALLGYYQRILRKVKTPESLVADQYYRPININELMYWFAFDSMGDFAFSEDIGMMRNKAWQKNIFVPAIWIARLGFAFIPGLWRVRDWFQMLAFCDQCMEQRMKKEVENRDIASWFIDDYVLCEKTNPNQHRWLSGDTATLVIAGSDTTAPSLSVVFYFLALYPDHAEKVYAELLTVNRTDQNALARLPHLNGTINESMRLLLAVLTFGYRVTPPEGLTIEGTFIPGSTKICTPRYSIGRLECAYEQPNDFIPERWYRRCELIKDKRAFAPFGVGRTACVGKHLAMVQIPSVVTSLVSQYRIEFAPGENNGEAVERDMKDQLTARPGKFHLLFMPR